MRFVADMTRSTSAPRFARFLAPLIDVLRAQGNAGSPPEVVDAVIARCRLNDVELDELTPGGYSRVRKQVHWARFYLARAGLLDPSSRGVWRLTALGAAADLDRPDAVRSLLRMVRAAPPRPDDSAKREAVGPSSHQ